MYLPKRQKGARQTERMTIVLGLEQDMPTGVCHICDYLSLIASALSYNKALNFLHQGRHSDKAWGANLPLAGLSPKCESCNLLMA